MPISNLFIHKFFLNKVRVETDYDEDDIDMIRYGLEAMLWELEKFIYLFIIFSLLGYRNSFMASLLVISTIKIFSGGMHVDSVWGCFFSTFLTFAIAIFALPNLISLNSMILLLVAIFSITITYIASPFRTAKREKIANKSNDKRKKITATFITIIWFLFIYFHLEHLFASAALWTVFLHNVQLLLVHVKKLHNT